MLARPAGRDGPGPGHHRRPQVATRIAADQVAAATAKNKQGPGRAGHPRPDGTTDWWARLPAGRSAAAWAAMRDLGDGTPAKDPVLTLDQARADAFLDLLLTNVTVTAKVTLGIPVITGPDGRPHAPRTHAADAGTPPADGSVHHDARGVPAGSRHRRPRPGRDFSVPAALLSGCEVPGIGFIDADTVEALLSVVPTDIGRALLDARTGTLMNPSPTPTDHPEPSPTSSPPATAPAGCGAAPAPPPAATSTTPDPGPTDRTTPTNLGGLCRRHHRLKQRRRWTYHLDPDGTATWTSPTGKRRMTYPQHTHWPPVNPPHPTGPRHRASQRPLPSRATVLGADECTCGQAAAR